MARAEVFLRYVEAIAWEAPDECYMVTDQLYPWDECGGCYSLYGCCEHYYAYLDWMDRNEKAPIMERIHDWIRKKLVKHDHEWREKTKRGKRFKIT